MDGETLLSDEPEARGFDEAIDHGAVPRSLYREVVRRLEGYGPREFQRRRQLIELVFRNQGITFTVYGDAAGTERSFPFDPVPRLIAAAEWALLERGLRQRVMALSRFLADVYGEQAILADGVVPHRLVLGNPAYRPRMRGVKLPFDTYTHVGGTDLIRDEDGRFLVLEDNLRVPSGVSYMLANRAVMARSFPRMMEATPVRPVRHYPLALLECLRSLGPREMLDPTVVVLTPGPLNSAYFEHAYLAPAHRRLPVARPGVPAFVAQRARRAPRRRSADRPAQNLAVPREVERQVGWLAAQVTYCPHVSRIIDDGEPSFDALLAALESISDGMARAYFGATYPV